MFTGIVSDIGRVERIKDQGDLRVRILSAYAPDGIALGASIACDGVCLTVVDRGPSDGGSWFEVEVSAETVSRTSIRQSRTPWAVGSRVNLERALRLGDELGGHIVSGHVDGLAEVVAVEDDGSSTRVTFEVPQALAPFIASKGSVALDGTSLTVNAVEGRRFGVNVIPHTKAQTTWSDIRPGDLVNLEVDTLARYVARLREYQT